LACRPYAGVGLVSVKQISESFEQTESSQFGQRRREWESSCRNPDDGSLHRPQTMAPDVAGCQNHFLLHATGPLRHSADPELHLKSVKLQLELETECPKLYQLHHS